MFTKENILNFIFTVSLVILMTFFYLFIIYFTYARLVHLDQINALQVEKSIIIEQLVSPSSLYLIDPFVNVVVHNPYRILVYEILRFILTPQCWVVWTFWQDLFQDPFFDPAILFLTIGFGMGYRTKVTELFFHSVGIDDRIRLRLCDHLITVNSKLNCRMDSLDLVCSIDVSLPFDVFYVLA